MIDRNVWRASLLVAFLLLAGCLSAPDVTRVASAPGTLATAKTFAIVHPAPSHVSNAEFSRDFLRLAFELESGRALPVFTRFAGPITIRLTGTKTRAVTSSDLDQLISRLQSEARLPVSRVGANQDASISVELVDARALHRLAPNAACFVSPNVSSWAEFQRARRTGVTDWTTLERRTRMAVFIPSSSSAQEIRDCLHEEIAQALGPVNDLFDLPNSVFNDDNFHGILTGYDMEVLRVYYDDALQNGMSQDAVATRLPAILARLRPQAAPYPARPDPGFTPPTWSDAIARALGPGASSEERVQSARWALETARNMGWRDTRLGFSLYAYGRLNALRNPDAALSALAEADRLYASLPDTDIQSAHVAVHSAVFALTTGHFETAIAISDQNAGIAARGQNAALLSTLLMIKAAALDATGQTAQAQSIRLDSLGWARYAFATEAEVQRRLEDINDMVPSRRRGGTS